MGNRKISSMTVKNNVCWLTGQNNVWVIDTVVSLL